MNAAQPKTSRRSPRRAFALAVASLLLGAPGALVAGAPAYAQTKPTNIPDLVDSVADAVVNISATQTIEDHGATPDAPKGTPFDDMFEEFFRRHGINPRPHARQAQSLGSGFVIDPTGIVITNNHVVGDANEIMVIFSDGRKLKAKVLGKDPKVDVAALKVESDRPLKTVKFGDSDKMRVGDGVIAVGNPFGLGETVTAGIISARNRNIDSGPYDDFLQTDASINKGNSGGPLFNMQGEVIGINTAILSPSGGSIGIGFATPSSTVAPVIAQLREFGETRRGWLGVRIQPVDDAIADSLGLKSARGALVAGVDDKGPAKPAGLLAGDVIVKFDGREIRESRDLPRLVGSMPVGKSVEVVVMRDGKEVTKTVTLGRLEDGETRTASLEDEKGQQSAVEKGLGMEFSTLTPELRKTYNIKDGVRGVVVTSVDIGSAAAERGLKAGDVIEEVNHQAVESPGDLAKAIANAKKSDGKKPALLLVSNAEGLSRFVAVPVN